MQQVKKESIQTKSRKDRWFKIIGISIIIIMLGILAFQYFGTQKKQDIIYCQINQRIDKPGINADVCAILKIVSSNMSNTQSGPLDAVGEVCAAQLSELNPCPEGKHYYAKFTTSLGYYCIGYTMVPYSVTTEAITELEALFQEKDVSSYDALLTMVDKCKGEIDG